MIRKLQMKIRGTLLLFLTVFMTVTLLLLAWVVGKSVADSFARLATQRIRQQNQNVESYLRLVEDFSQIISTDAAMADEIRQGDPLDSINDTLNNDLNMTLGLSGITILAADGRTYSSTNGYSSASRNTMLNAVAQNRTADGKVSFWTIRYQDVNPATDRAPGYFSYVSDIRAEDGGQLGYLVMDTSFDELYRNFTGDSGEYFKNISVYLLAADGKMFASPQNPAGNGLDRATLLAVTPGTDAATNHGKGMLAAVDLPKAKDRVVEYIPMNILNDLVPAELLVVGVYALFLLLCWKGVALVSDSVILPLTALYKKIRHTDSTGGGPFAG